MRVERVCRCSSWYVWSASLYDGCGRRGGGVSGRRCGTFLSAMVALFSAMVTLFSAMAMSLSWSFALSAATRAAIAPSPSVGLYNARAARDCHESLLAPGGTTRARGLAVTRWRGGVGAPTSKIAAAHGVSSGGFRPLAIFS